MRYKVGLRQFVLLAIWGAFLSGNAGFCHGSTKLWGDLPFEQFSYSPNSISSWQFTENLTEEQNEKQALILGQNRYTKQLKNYGIWGNLYGYEGRLRPKNSVFTRLNTSDLGMQIGLDLPGDAMFSKCFYYSFASPDYTIRASQIPLFNNSELGMTNHLFGVRWLHYSDGLFMLFNLNGGFDNYEFQTPNSLPTLDASGWQMGGNCEFGVDVLLEKWRLRPYFGFDYRWLHHNNLSGSGLTLFDSQTHNALYSNLGMRTYYTIMPLLDWQMRLSWQHNYLKKDPIQVQRFGSVAGLSTSTQLFFDGHPGNDWCWFGTGLKLHFGDFLSFFVDYDLTFNEYATTHTGSVMAVLSW